MLILNMKWRANYTSKGGRVGTADTADRTTVRTLPAATLLWAFGPQLQYSNLNHSFNLMGWFKEYEGKKRLQGSDVVTFPQFFLRYLNFLGIARV